MTALTEYDRLEASGIWRPAHYLQRRDVLISLGDATLSIFDQREQALAHWSLPAVERLNPGQMPALYAPGLDASEQLETDDETMIQAIEKVRQVVARRRPHRGRLRYVLMAGCTSVLLAAAVFWLPDALIRHTASVVPSAARKEIGDRMLVHFTRVAGDACRNPMALPSLRALRDRLLGPGGGQIVVLKGGVKTSLHLPGGLILANRALFEGYDGPDTAASYILAERERAKAGDPLLRLLESAGAAAALTLLTTGRIDDDILKSYVEQLSILPAQPPGSNVMLDKLAVRRDTIPRPDGWAEAEPAPNDPAPADPDQTNPIISDGQWVALQGICET